MKIIVNKAIYLSSSQFITWSISVECINDLCLLLHFPLLKLLQMQKAEEEEVRSETEVKIGCLNVIDTVIKLCTDGWDYTLQLSGLLVNAIQTLTHGGSNYLTYNRTPNDSLTTLRAHNMFRQFTKNWFSFNWVRKWLVGLYWYYWSSLPRSKGLLYFQVT